MDGEATATRRRWWSRKRDDRHQERTLTRSNLPATFFASATRDTAVTPTNAMAIADVFACVRALADAAASLPLIMYRRTANGRERHDNATAALLRNPAPAITMAGFIGQIVAHLNLWGNSYVGKYRDASGEIAQLGCLPPSAMTVELKGGLPVYTYTDPYSGPRTTHTTADIVHIKALSTDGLVGLSPVRQCRLALGLSDQLVRHASEFFANSARPSGILKVPPGPAATEHIENLRRAWEERHGGAKNAHRIAVLSGEVEFAAVSMPHEDAQFIEQRQWSTNEVCRVFRVPPAMLGAPTGDSLTYSTVEQQSLHFVQYGLRPHLVAVEQAISADADLFGGNTYCEFLLDGLLRADARTRAETYATALDHGWMTVDEVRERENLPPLPPSARIPAASMNGNGPKPEVVAA